MRESAIKQRVRESFDRAAVTYDAAAVVQRRVCDRLLEGIDPLPRTPARILDAGCGTGYGARLLRARWPGAKITGIDFAPAMLALAAAHLDAGYAADIERLPIASSSQDLWWSSLSIQWCDNDAVFREAARVLATGGRVAFSTLSTETFAELREAFADIDQHRHTLPFDDPETLRASLIRAGFRNIRLVRERHAVHYPDLKSLLRSIKAIGAQNVGEGGRNGMMGRAAWKKVEAAYEKYREPAGLPAGYDVILGYACK